MPIFRINILFANGKLYKGYHLVDGVELDTYYRHLFRLTQKASIPLRSFDVVQVSEFSREATYMRENNLKKMDSVPHVQTRPGMVKRRRRM